MNIGVPTWNSQTSSYSFKILSGGPLVEKVVYVELPTGKVDLPATIDGSLIDAIVRDFLEKTRKYFTNPLTPEKVLRHLTHTTVHGGVSIAAAGWYTIAWKPIHFVVKANTFQLAWQVDSAEETVPLIPAEFTAQTPRASTPESPEQPKQVRTIQIHDSLIPVGDLPLSDLPPISFPTEEMDPSREETKRRVREARLKVALAKLKAQRMEQKYYERYGQTMEESEDSSEFSSDSEEELPFERGMR
jgi:hypothetical protein